MRTQGHSAQSPKHLELRVNWEKSKLSPAQRISFLGMELDSVNLTGHLSIERAQSMLNCLESFQGKRVVPLKQFQRLLGHMASADAVTPLGLLHMSFSAGFKTQSQWHVPGLSHTVLPSDLQPVVGSCFSFHTARVSVQACCCINRCL